MSRGGRTQHLGRNVFEIGAHARVMVYSQLCVLAGCSKFAKAALAEYILRAAAEGQTNYESLVAAASDQIPTILSMLT